MAATETAGLAKKQIRNDAMLSVYQACSESKGAVIPAQAAAMPLNEAVEILLDDKRWDKVWDAYFIRQRALVRLLRAEVHRRHPLGDVVNRLAVDVGCTPEGVRKTVDDPARDGPTKERKCFNALRVPMRDRYRRGFNLDIGRDFDLQRRSATTQVLYSPTDLTSTVRGTVEVSGEPGDFAEMIDPRHWAHIPDSQFRAAFATDPSGWDGEGEPPEIETRPPAGTPWKGVLYEHVCFRLNGATQSRFRNLLHIDLIGDRNQIRANYRLYQSLSNQLGLVERPGGIDVDHGFFAARRAKERGRTEIVVEKTLRYTDTTPRDTGAGAWDYGQTMNYLAPSLLGMWIEAVLTEVGEKVYERAGKGP